MKYIFLFSLSLLSALILSTPLLWAMPPMLEEEKIVDSSEDSSDGTQRKYSFISESLATSIPYSQDGSMITLCEISEVPYSLMVPGNEMLNIKGSSYPSDNSLESPRESISSELEDQKKFEERVLDIIQSLRMLDIHSGPTKEGGGRGTQNVIMDLIREKIVPFIPSDVKPYSLKRLASDIGMSVHHEREECCRMIHEMSSTILTELEAEVEGLETEKKSTFYQNIIKYLQLQQDGLTECGAILEGISNEMYGKKVFDFFDHDFVYLMKSLRLYEDAVQAAEKYRLDKAPSLATQALGYLSFIQEKSQSSPREDILKKYKKAFALLQESEEALARGEEEEAHRLTLQAEILLSQNQEKLGNVRENIIKDYQTSLKLVKKAKKSLVTIPFPGSDAIKAMYFMNQSKARYYATSEAAAREPREDIIQGYAASSAFFGQAIQAQKEGKYDLAESFNNQGLALLKLIREKVGLNRSEIIESYQKSLGFFQNAQNGIVSEALDTGQIQYNNNAAQAWLGFAEEKARLDGPRKNITDLYKNCISFFTMAVAAKDKEEAESCNQSGLFLLPFIEEQKNSENGTVLL